MGVMMKPQGICYATILVFSALAVSCSGGTSPPPAQQANTPPPTPPQPAAQPAPQPPPPVAAQPAPQLPPPGAQAVPQPAPQPPAASEAAPATVPAAGQASVIQTQETNLEGVMGEITECRRSEGVLTIKVRFRNTSNATKRVAFNYWNQTTNDNAKFYVTAGNKKYFMLADGEGTVLSTNSIANGVAIDLDAGKTYLWWAKYPAPPAEVKKINFTTPLAPPFEDVPVTDQ